MEFGRLSSDRHLTAPLASGRTIAENAPVVAGRQLRLGVRQPDPHSVVIDVVGEVDLATAPNLQTLVTWSLHSHSPQVIIDLSSVEFLAAAGLNILVRAHLEAERQGKRLLIVTGGSRPVLRSLRAGGLDNSLPLSVGSPIEPTASHFQDVLS